MLVFAGDSVTDSGRRDDPEGLGQGWVRLVADAHPAARVVNRGRGGDLLRDLEERWTADVLAHDPDVVTALIGVNDTWRRYDEGRTSPVDEFQARYDRMLAAAVAGGARLVLVEPFVVPVTPQQRAWREDLDPRIEAVHRLAARWTAVLVRADAGMRRHAEQVGAAALAADGVHPTALGHRVLADLWLAAVAAVTA